MRKKIFWWVLAALWCGLIFSQSAKPANISGQESGIVAGFINYWLVALTGNSGLTVSDMLVRKTAHYLEYFVLGFLLFAAIHNQKRLTASLLISIAAGVLYAATDEIHQYFVPGRAMRFYDVGIDAAGIVSAVLISYCLVRRKKAAA